MCTAVSPSPDPNEILDLNSDATGTAMFWTSVSNSTSALRQPASGLTLVTRPCLIEGTPDSTPFTNQTLSPAFTSLKIFLLSSIMKTVLFIFES